MGEAKRRRDAAFAAQPYRPPRVCPKCRSVRVDHIEGVPPTALSHVPTAYDRCRECGTFWEAYPDDWCEDVVGAEPCDNCAFRPGSPEQADREGWAKLVDQLRLGAEFRCHKGAPIVIDSEGSPRFDLKALPPQRQRQCAGFMRMVWAMRDKGHDWLRARYENALAPGYDLPEPQQEDDNG